jgi:plastocyanin
MVHPWMIGKITVTGSEVVIENKIEPQQEETIMEQVDTTPIITDTISIASFADSSDCDTQKNCISPYHAQVTINQNVTWSATPFTTSIASGNSTSGLDGIFNFGFKINEKSVHTFNQTGTFEYFDLMHPWIAGTVTVTSENFLMHLYNILQTQLLLPSAFAVTEFPITTDSDSYTHGQVVKVSGITSEKNISLQVKDPSGKTVLIRTLPAEGNFSYEMSLPNYFKIGQYNIFASVTVDNIPKIVSKSIYLLDENGELGPIHSSSIIVRPESSEEQTQSSEEQTQSSDGGGCLIATAAFGSEMAPQVQFLREIRDNTVMSTQSGTAFMTGFNQFYYSFSPYVADYERENPVFKEAVKVTLTPLLTSLTLLNYVDVDTEEEMLGYGIGIILLNIGMYFVAPVVLIISLKKRLDSFRDQ